MIQGWQAGANASHAGIRGISRTLRAGCYLATLLLACAPLLQSCNPRADAASEVPALEIRLTVRNASGAIRRAFGSAEAVTFELAVRNVGDTRETVVLASAKTHDFVVTSSDGREIWRASRGRFFAQMLTELSFAPGETRRFTSTWDQVRADGTAAVDGEYSVAGFLATALPRAALNRALFAIR